MAVFSGFSRNTILLPLASFFADISTEMLYPILPVFLTQTLGAGGSVVGLVDGLAQAAQNAVQGFSGALSDRLRRRKPVALVGYLVAAIAKPLTGLAASWEAVLGARLLDRLGAGSRSAPRDALIAASVKERDRGKAFGLEGFGDNAGACLGPLIAVLLLYGLHQGLRGVFYLTAIPGLLAFSMVLLVSEPPAAHAAQPRLEADLRRFPPAYWKFLAATALFCLGNSSNAFLILRARDLGASLETTILIYAGFNLAAALVSYPAGSLSDRWGRRNLLLAALLIFLVSYLGFALAEGALAVAVLFAAYGAFQGIFRAVGKAFAADLVPPPLRAGGIGWYQTTIGMLQLAASLIAGALWDRVGHAAVFYFGAGFAVLGSVALIVLVPASAGAPAPTR